jgi:hypothetical protein
VSRRSRGRRAAAVGVRERRLVDGVLPDTGTDGWRRVRVGVRVPRRAPVTQVDTDTHTDHRLEEDLDLEKGKHAHIVKVDPGEDAAAKVLEARIYGYPIEALCGHRWVPSKDPKQLPVCGQCKEIYEMYRTFNGKLPDTPRT